MNAQAAARLTLCWLALLAVPASAQTGVSEAAPGRLLPVAGSRMHIYCTGAEAGAGAATVVLQAGLGGNVLDWVYVQPVLALHHRVCSFDRFGAGWSERTDRPRSADAMAEELHLLLAAAGETGPFMMVGHSLGGLLSLHHAQRYPGEVAALVLLDTMHPDQFTRFPEAGVDLPDDPHLVLGRTPVAAAAYGMPPDRQRLAQELAAQGKARVFVVREMLGFVSDAHEVRALPLPRLASRVLVHGNREWDQAYSDGRMENAWTTMQANLALEMGAPPPTVLRGSGHQIPLDAPQAVVDAVEALAPRR